MALRVAARLGLKVGLHPQAVVFQRLLLLPAAALRQEISQAAEENPALELPEDWVGAVEYEAQVPRGGGRFRRHDEDQDGGAPEIAAGVSLQQHLWASAALEISDPLLRRIAHYLIHNLDDDGYLGCDLKEVARHFAADAGNAARALRLVQRLDPAGVGARDLRECLLIQMGRLRGRGIHPQAEAILRDHWGAFVRRRFDQIARGIGRPAREVQEAADFIRTRLAPYPGRQFRLPWQPPAAPPAPPEPDVIVLRRNGGWEVETAEGPDCNLRLSPSYLEVYEKMRTNGVGYTEEQRKHVVAHVRRVQWLLQALDQRRRTLKRIADLMVSLEGPFFEHGVEGLVPLSQKALARRLAVSPSTVSRALAEKHLLTPAGEVVSFDLFFDRSLPAKQMIRRLLEREDKARPLSDREMASRLAGEGVRWARRTVAKYREELGILSRSKRARKH